MNNFKPVYKGQLEMASIRLVKDAPIMSENEIHNPGDAVKLLGEYLCEMDREVLCIINVKTNGIPINCSICNLIDSNYTLNGITGGDIEYHIKNKLPIAKAKGDKSEKESVNFFVSILEDMREAEKIAEKFVVKADES